MHRQIKPVRFLQLLVGPTAPYSLTFSRECAPSLRGLVGRGEASSKYSTSVSNRSMQSHGQGVSFGVQMFGCFRVQLLEASSEPPTVLSLFSFRGIKCSLSM